MMSLDMEISMQFDLCRTVLCLEVVTLDSLLSYLGIMKISLTSIDFDV